MSAENLDGIITLIDDNGNEMEFEVLDCIKNEKGRFYALLPGFDLPNNSKEDEETYFIFEVKKSDSNGGEHLEEVEDDQLLDELSVIFEKHFDENVKVN